MTLYLKSPLYRQRHFRYGVRGLLLLREFFCCFFTLRRQNGAAVGPQAGGSGGYVRRTRRQNKVHETGLRAGKEENGERNADRQENQQ